jgi:hypothetical protein
MTAVAFVFDPDPAMKADEGGSIKVGGVYVGTISSAVSFSNDSGAGGVEFAFNSPAGNARFVKVYTKNGDNSENFNKGKILALMGLTGVRQVTMVADGQRYKFPELVGKKIAFHLQKKEYLNQKGELKYDMNLLHFYNPETLKTYKEQQMNLEAETSKVVVDDILVQQPKAAEAPRTFASHTAAPVESEQNFGNQDNLPF